MSKITFLLLIIYTLFLPDVSSQNLNLKIVGETNTETIVIDSLDYNKTHLNYSLLKSEVDSIQLKLFKKGYIHNKVIKMNKINDSTFNAFFQLKKKYNTIFIYYNKNDVAKSILNLVSEEVNDEYFVLAIHETENALSFINSKIAEQGLPFNSLRLSEIKAKGTKTLIAKLIVSEKTQKRTIDKIIVKGYEKFPKSYLKHYLKIRSSEFFNITSIKEKTDLLNDLRFANEIREPEILFTKDSTTLYLYIKKIKSNTFDGFLGFGTNEKTDKVDFNGYLNLELNNNLNYGESFNLIYKSDENEQKTFDVKLNLPYLFSSPLGTELQLSIFKRDSSFTTVNQIAKLYYQLNSKSKVFFGINAIQSNDLLSDENSIATIKDYKTTFYNARFQHVSRQNNNRLFTTNLLFDFEAGIGTRQFDETSERQTQLLLETFKIFNLNLKNSIFLRLNGFGLFSDIYLENELHQFGGINSIRGFEENSLSASFYSLINTEYRFKLNSTIYIHTIMDASYFENKITDQKEKLYGLGFGFGIVTKAGLLRFNYANGKSENQKFKFSNSQIHLSLTSLF